MTPPRDLLLPPIVLDRAMSVPLHQQLRGQLVSAIRASATGTRLPSSRLLARLLGISRNTVLAVYDDLVAEGLVEGRRGAAMVISAGPGLPPSPFNPRLLLREAGCPVRTVALVDADGNPLWLTY